MSSKVFVGLSGGVDSSVTAALLQKQGYDVTGVFMKNWAQDIPGFKCPWREDYADAKRVSVQLKIPFKMYDFQTQYKQKVVDYMIAEYQAGRTPNPDIMCNQEVKFKLFLETALQDGADMIATGHYARVASAPIFNSQLSIFSQPQNPNDLFDSAQGKQNVKSPASSFQLLTSKDTNKDQTYFLYRVTEEALAKTLFPLGEYIKPEVRKLAEQFGLATAKKKESMGICFVGKVGIKEFLQQYVETKPGDIVTTDGVVVGQHDGAIFYTIGQRHGLNVGGGLPYYVVGKDMQKNEVYVTTDLNDGALWQSNFTITDVHWINGQPSAGQYARWSMQNGGLQVRTRHRSPLIHCQLTAAGDQVKITPQDEIRALTPGQSAVLYDGATCLGGGIIV